MTWEEAAEAVQREQELAIVAEIAADGRRKPIPRTKLGAPIWHLLGWCWLNTADIGYTGGLPFMGTAPSVHL